VEARAAVEVRAAAARAAVEAAARAAVEAVAQAQKQLNTANHTPKASAKNKLFVE
jgi:hypothetical protein